MTTMKKRIRIAAPLGAVYKALTDPGALQVWLAEHAEVDLPDRYQFWGRFTPNGEAPHQLLRQVDDSSLRFDWELDGVYTTVDIGLVAESGPDGDSGSTLLTLTQTEVPGWPEVLTPEDADALLQARDAGAARAAEVARRYYPDDAARQAVAERYLRDNIRYTFGDEELEGLRTFYAYAAELGLVAFDGALRFYHAEHHGAR